MLKSSSRLYWLGS